MSAPLPSRLAWSAYAFAHAQRERWLPWQDLERTLATQSRRVQRIVRHAFERVPFYRDAMRAAGLLPRDFQTAADLALLPLIDSKTYAAHPAACASHAPSGRTKQSSRNRCSSVASQPQKHGTSRYGRGCSAAKR